MIRKSLEQSKQGVVLIRIDDLSAGDRPIPLGYRLSTPWSVVGIADRDEAHAAFAAELKALNRRPVAPRRAAAGR